MEFSLEISNSIFTVLQNGDWGLVTGDKGDEEAGEQRKQRRNFRYQLPNTKHQIIQNPTQKGAG
ncbi:hypothetical protein H6G27_15785 [Nostoc linckia FACHB-104]|nr:hypothetical protein [Nostoc linckia FACHB-104]